MRCHTIVYARRSSSDDDRQVLSLDAQERECRLFLERENSQLDELVRESHSARKPGRPLFTAMIAKVEKLLSGGSQVRVLCHKPDRLLRNLADWARINDLVDAGLILDFVTGSFPNNAQGKMAFGIMALAAKYYVDNLSEEVKKGLTEKLERGEWPGWAPPGYVNADKHIVVDDVTGGLWQRAFEDFATGEYSLDELRSKLNAEGLTGPRHGRPIQKSVLHRVLTNPFYCGLMRYRGQLIPGTHSPLVTVELFQKVQDVLRAGSRPRKIRREFRYAGVMRCRRCQCAIVGDIKKARYVYYRCSHRRGSCSEPYVREERLRELIADEVATRVRLSAEAETSLREAAVELHQELTRGTTYEPTVLERRLKDLENRQAALLDIRLSGRISDAQFLTKQDELTLEHAHVREQLSAFELPAADPREAVDWFVSRCGVLRDLLLDGEDSEVRELLRIVGSNYRFGGGEIDFEPVPPFDYATQARNRPYWRAGADDVRTICAAATLFH